MAGRRARPSGADCQCDSSSGESSSWYLAARGKKRSSVDERMVFRASDTESDKVELRRWGWGPGASAMVAARVRPRWRRLMGLGEVDMGEG